MLKEDSAEIRSFHACERRDCTRIFCESTGYSDRVDGEFDDARAEVRSCPSCGAGLYLSEVDHTRKIETWECPHPGCDFSEDYPSPSGR